MPTAEVDPRRRNHIRSIKHYFLSGTDSRTRTFDEHNSRYQVMVCGTPGSAWVLPLAANLALTVSQSGESCLLSSPSAILPLLARLLGASHDQLGLDLLNHQHDCVLQPHPGLTLVPDSMLPLLAEQPTRIWHFRLTAEQGVRGAWLFLQDGPGETGFRDPRSDKGDPLFLLGKDRQPRPRPEAYGIWGRLPGDLLLCPDRPSWPAVLGRSRQARNQYNGYVQALKRVLAHDREKVHGAGLMRGRL